MGELSGEVFRGSSLDGILIDFITQRGDIGEQERDERDEGTLICLCTLGRLRSVLLFSYRLSSCCTSLSRIVLRDVSLCCIKSTTLVIRLFIRHI